MIVLFMKRGGCWTAFSLREMTIDRILFALNKTNQSFAHLEIVCKSTFRTACYGRSTMIYKLVSSANDRIEPPIRLAMSLIKM